MVQYFFPIGPLDTIMHVLESLALLLSWEKQAVNLIDRLDYAKMCNMPNIVIQNHNHDKPLV